MTVTSQQVRKVIDTYIRAWTEQDPDLIITIFTENATYHERVLEEPIRGRDGIREYWQSKTVESQRNIECKVLALYLDGNTAIVEWEARFDDLPQRVRKLMREVAILNFEGSLIASLREYWASKEIGTLAPAEAPKTDSGMRVSRTMR